MSVPATDHEGELKQISAGGFAASKAGADRLLPVAVLRLLRPHQWVKNLLLFAPLVLAHELGNPARLRNVILAFVALCACASAAYVINDMLDMTADRLHPRKRHRPLAAGQITPSLGALLTVTLLLGGMLLSALTLPAAFTGLLGLYVLVSTAYTLWIKKKIIADVLTLSGLYTLRILAGGVAADVAVSEWLLAFSLFLFTSLAFAKRATEIAGIADRGETWTLRRGYSTDDDSIIYTMGVTNGYLAVLVLALYINSSHVREMYHHPNVLWLLCPMLMYWISRLWIFARRGTLHDDPVVFALQDRVSLAIAVLAALLIWLASTSW